MSESSSVPVGSVWSIPSKSNVKVTRPDGSEVTVLSDGKVALYVLDLVGEHVADLDGKPSSAKAV